LGCCSITYRHHRASTLPLIAGLFAGLYPLIMEDPGASGLVRSLQLHAQLLSRTAATADHAAFNVKKHVGSSLQLHAQLLSEIAATADHAAYTVKDMSEITPRMPLTGRLQC